MPKPLVSMLPFSRESCAPLKQHCTSELSLTNWCGHSDPGASPIKLRLQVKDKQVLEMTETDSGHLMLYVERTMLPFLQVSLRELTYTSIIGLPPETLKFS